jgi:hypothetical protein
MKGNKIIVSLLIAMLLVEPALAQGFDVPTQNYPGNQIWLEDQFGSSDIYYDTTDATIGTTFTVTVFLNTTLAKLAAWQFQMYFDGSWLQVLSCVYSGTGNAQSQFFEQAGTNNVRVSAVIGPGSLLYAEAWYSGPYPGALQGGSSVAYILFNITGLPTVGSQLSTNLDITTSPDTCFQDEEANWYRGIGNNGTVTFAWAPPAITVLSPQNQTYYDSAVPLNFTVYDYSPISWMGYSLDGEANVTISGNTTLFGLSDGTHVLTAYANDTTGYMGSSSEVFFTVETSKLCVYPSTTSVATGRSFNVSIQVSNVSDLYLWVFSIRWDPATLEFMSIAEGDFLSRGGTTTGILTKVTNQTGGYLEEAACSLLGNVPGVSGEGILATLTFRAKTIGSSFLDIYFHDLMDSNSNSILSYSVNGSVDVFAAPDLSILGVSIAYPELPKYANMTMPINVTIENIGTAGAGAFNVSFSAYWNDGGLLEYDEEQRAAGLDVNTTSALYFSFTPLRNGSYTLAFKVDCDDEILESNETNNELSLLVVVYLQGDITGDGQVRYQDLFILAKAYWSTPADSNWDPSADLNYDGRVDYRDLFIFSRNYSS